MLFSAATELRGLETMTASRHWAFIDLANRPSSQRATSKIDLDRSANLKFEDTMDCGVITQASLTGHTYYDVPVLEHGKFSSHQCRLWKRGFAYH